MGTRITGGEPPKNKKPEIEIGCLNRKHRDIVYFKIKRGEDTAKCPVCGRRAGRSRA